MLFLAHGEVDDGHTESLQTNNIPLMVAFVVFIGLLALCVYGIQRQAKRAKRTKAQQTDGEI